MFPIGVAFLVLGYAFLYTGTANVLNGGQGPRLAESLGVPAPVAPPSQKPNLSGQPPVSTFGTDTFTVPNLGGANG